MTILDVKDLSVSFIQYAAGLRQQEVKVITSLNVAISPGEVLAVVGSSGSGKSLLAHAILGILPVNARVTGSMRFDGKELTPARQAKLRGRDIALVPQSVNFLDPLMRVGKQVRTGVRGGDPGLVQREVFSRYHLSEHVDRLFPFQLSGGMARRVLVSTAIVSGARLVIADEPTPGLDEAAVKETLGFFRQMADEGCAVMLITHDIATAVKIADNIAVFYAGTTVEAAPAKDFAGDGAGLRHPYSKALWLALPQNGFISIPGFQPSPAALPPGCLFQPRCSLATASCAAVQPEAREVRHGMVRCIYAS
ncbi:MAG TPA: ABC transporter ATP-binding protein [Methylomusa anaerophila]|uniref:Nickel import system ATP-binding protein NikD n=1 Tax=Methylomusa anaerophila TaxID=1930071 RepID=A0A348AEC9_9FIRM|nr:ABC transporter ATP-binding protein [Methylomusa anaerophila]BBB89427.1 putative D,D-dipeptide transport ATP-binding protein DdpD [Methylomusa anaerophila]HML89661.1 ABC transporter ATP-binding protein [Methylomusa anaerophila]